MWVMGGVVDRNLPHATKILPHSNASHFAGLLNSWKRDFLCPWPWRSNLLSTNLWEYYLENILQKGKLIPRKIWKKRWFEKLWFYWDSVLPIQLKVESGRNRPGNHLTRISYKEMSHPSQSIITETLSPIVTFWQSGFYWNHKVSI